MPGGPNFIVRSFSSPGVYAWETWLIVEIESVKGRLNKSRSNLDLSSAVRLTEPLLLGFDPTDKSAVSELALESANGAKCKSLGQRPRYKPVRLVSAEGAQSAPLTPVISRFQRFNSFSCDYPGRRPGLLHFAPSALSSGVLTQPLNAWATEKSFKLGHVPQAVFFCINPINAPAAAKIAPITIIEEPMNVCFAPAKPPLN
jgi:hypothetical protein